MSEELTRYKDALASGIKTLTAITQIQPPFDDRHIFAQSALNEISSILNLPPEMEDVAIVRWAIVAPSGFVELTASSEQLAEREVAEDGRYPGYQVAKLTGTIKRPVKRPVVKSCPMTLTGEGWIGDGLDIAGEDTFPLKGTFTWQK